MKENKDRFTEEEEKRIRDISERLEKLEYRDQEKMKWIMIGMRIANDNVKVS